MKLTKCSLALVLSLLLTALSGCADKETADQVAPQDVQPEKAAVEEQQPEPAPEQLLPPQPAQLPVRFQTPGYLAANQQMDQELDQAGEEYRMKVGATIRSTGGPQPLWDILNRLAGLKQMSVSWASDVDQNVLVDVNITAEEDFFSAIDNMLRQVEYHQVVEGNTILVKHRETMKFYISIPNIKGNFTTTVGGNYLTDREAATGTEGTVKITSADNQFDIWANIETNLDTIMQQWATTTVAGSAPAGAAEGEEAEARATRRMASGGSFYTIDKSIGLVTVTAPRPCWKRSAAILKTSRKNSIARL